MCKSTWKNKINCIQIKIETYTNNMNVITKANGIVIDDHLSWAPHIDYLCSTISSKISLLRHISIYVPQNIQKIFYQSYIQPLLDYGCNTWGNKTAANIERLSKLQKRAARIILRADFMTPSTIMFGRLEWLSVPNA